MLYCFFVYWHLSELSWLKDQDSGFRNRAIKHSLKTRQLILGYRGSPKRRKTIGTPPCTLIQPRVSVIGPIHNFEALVMGLATLHEPLWVCPHSVGLATFCGSAHILWVWLNFVGLATLHKLETLQKLETWCSLTHMQETLLQLKFKPIFFHYKKKRKEKHKVWWQKLKKGILLLFNGNLLISPQMSRLLFFSIKCLIGFYPRFGCISQRSLVTYKLCMCPLSLCCSPDPTCLILLDSVNSFCAQVNAMV